MSVKITHNKKHLLDAVRRSLKEIYAEVPMLSNIEMPEIEITKKSIHIYETCPTIYINADMYAEAVDHQIVLMQESAGWLYSRLKENIDFLHKHPFENYSISCEAYVTKKCEETLKHVKPDVIDQLTAALESINHVALIINKTEDTFHLTKLSAAKQSSGNYENDLLPITVDLNKLIELVKTHDVDDPYVLTIGALLSTIVHTRHLTSANNQEELDTIRIAIVETVIVATLVLCHILKLLSCKNTVLVPYSGLSKEHAKLVSKKPLTEHNLIYVSPDNKVIDRDNIDLAKLISVNDIASDTNNKKTITQRRAHFRTYTEERPLFGKIAGTFYIPAILKADTPKDYKM